MEFDGKDEAIARESAREAKTNVTPIRPERGNRKQNKTAAKAEAINAGVNFEFDGKAYTLAPADDWDLDVMEFFSEGDALKAAKVLFEDEQWQAFRTGPDGEKIKRTNRDLGEFLEAAMKALGVDTGESSS